MPSRILDRNVGGNTTYARELAARLPRHGVSVERLRSASKPALTMLAESWDSYRKRPESVIHFVADTGPVIKPRTPSVVTVHGVASRWIKTARNTPQELIWRSRVSAALRFSDRVVTVSQSSADDIAEVFGVERSAISVIPHGITLERFGVAAPLSQDIDEKLPSEFILYLGNIEPRKNLIELISAVEGDESIPRLVIAGKPAWNFAATMEVINNSKRVLYLGFVTDSDRTALMKRCKAFVFPSLYEGFGFPVLEAMAAGAPVITTNRGSLKEVSGPAWILDETDRESIALGIGTALADDAWLKKAPWTGQEWAATFSWEESVRRHVDLYKELVQ